MRSAALAAVLLLAGGAAHADLPEGKPRFDRVPSAGGSAAGRDDRPDMKLPSQLEGIGIDDKHGADLPKDLRFLDQDGKEVKLGDYTGDKPFILVLAYYECPMLCSLVLNKLTEQAKDIDFDLGTKYRMLTVSIDPRDTPKSALTKRATYLEAYGKPLAGERAWDFLAQKPGDPVSVKTLADTVGFHYRWDAETSQFAHAAGVFVFTPGGKLSRVFYGIDYKARDLRLGLVEASEGKLGSPWDKVLLFCFHYDPKGYSLAIVKLMQVGGAVFVGIVGIFLTLLWRREQGRPARA